ncbi:MAG: glycosyltransferase family 4 protein, partial [Terracidiphilus sp.]
MIPTVALGALVSFAACLALTPVVRKLCLRYGAVDRPGPLKIHSHLVPRLGGLAVTLSIAAGVLLPNRQDARANALFFAALAVIWLAGFVDDLRSISPYARLVAQVVSGTISWCGGWRFTFAGQLPTSGAVSLVAVCFLVVLFANSFNFLDGSDGLAAGVAAVVGASYLVISQGAADADPFARLIAACLFGSCVAFLVYNFAPAKIHLGDSGSTVLGFCVAFLALIAPHSIHPVSLLQLSPLLIAGVP